MDATTASAGSTDSPRTIQSYLRLAFAALLAWLTWLGFHDAYGNVPIVSDVLTAIHEFGHMLFMPFGIPILGGTMVILGGSLTEVAFPLLFAGYFLRKREDGRRRDVFAAMVCLWWSAIGLLATAIYCADSRAGKLMLLDGLTGQESEGHDWYNLLDRWGLLEHDTQIARWMRMIAWLMCVGSILVAVWRALQQQPERNPSTSVPSAHV
jgi:TRAP-type C4-dicarboxylate transport system permease small subunit